MQIAFGEFVLDTDRRQVLRELTPVPLSTKAFQLLRTLAESHPRALSKDDLLQAVWPGWLVGESSLTNLVSEVRQALRDPARSPRFIRTVHGFGYAFSGAEAVVRQAPAAHGGPLVCRLLWGAREVVLLAGESVIGRHPEAAIWLDDYRVSRRHARIVVGATVATLEDMGSRNGTFHRGARLSRTARLADGDEIRIGEATFVVRLHLATTTTVTES